MDLDFIISKIKQICIFANSKSIDTQKILLMKRGFDLCLLLNMHLMLNKPDSSLGYLRDNFYSLVPYLGRVDKNYFLTYQPQVVTRAPSNEYILADKYFVVQF